MPQPINISALLKGRVALERDEIDRTVKDLRARMQASLDGINAEIGRLPPGRGGFIREPNPFFEPGLAREA